MYQFPIKSQGIKRNQVTAMHIMAALLFIGMGAVAFLAPFFFGLAKASKEHRPELTYEWINWAGLLYIILGFIIMVIVIFVNKKILQTGKNLVLRLIEITALIAVIAYAAYMRWTLPVIYSAVGLAGIVMAYYFEKRTGKQYFISIDDSEIVIQNNAFGKTYKWQNVKNVILKNNVLTIDNKDNTIYQAEIIIPDNTSLKDFIAYCKKQIEQHAHLYQPDWS